MRTLDVAIDSDGFKLVAIDSDGFILVAIYSDGFILVAIDSDGLILVAFDSDGLRSFVRFPLLSIKKLITRRGGPINY